MAVFIYRGKRYKYVIFITII